ncbi:glucan biosynthesis protein [Nitratireductor basaltis]|uniref:Glucan biosynthesis protein D n=1 Tax=Nitratireductor basaltis TaxID=472175 RepID=A0A084U7K1_9HYPH|nr:glucan biosynthesis protein G [Nitratireductor basaltis]KFB08937.1 Glucan biosynthesis protein D [Nitratireductor basaltis]
MNRRSLLLNGCAAVLASHTVFAASSASAQSAPEPVGASEAPAGNPFSFDRLTAMMKERAAKAYEAAEATLPDAIAELNYDQHRAIRFRPDEAVWAGEAPFELQAFHPGWLFKEPVKIHVVEDGVEEVLGFDSHHFEYNKPLEASDFEGLKLPGVAGFRLHYPLNSPDVMDELVAFLGASYFRGLGRGNFYGLSARGLAVNTATSEGEEFPRFSEFWIEKPKRQSKSVTVYAALDSQSVTGAYRFVITPGARTQMDVTARLFIREDIKRLGIAPMTSMFLFAENNDSSFDDFRPQVHDSDGLKIVRASGEELWRNLNNPRKLATSFFSETSPKAFGLYQRDRNFQNYQDAGAGYERRPSLLVEPEGDWGKGWINLVEIPTDLEVNDNIVAFWVPEGEVKAGQELEFAYRLSWGDLPEPGKKLGRVVALRTGEGGVSGVKNEEGLRKFVIDFDGEVLRNLSSDDEVLAQISVSNAEITHSGVSRVEANGVWRLVIDLLPEGDKPVEMKAHLAIEDEAVTETWLYQWRNGDDRRS